MPYKTIKLLYWVTTGLLAAFILPGIFFLAQPFALEGSGSLGIPTWLHYEVGIGTFIGGVLLILPMIPARFKEWGYVGLGIVYLSALIGHLTVDGFVLASFMPLVNFAILLTSYLCWQKMKEKKNSANYYKNEPVHDSVFH